MVSNLGTSMRHDKAHFLHRLFGYHIVHGEIIPPDTQVDPESFPEKDFPLFCPVCDYMLRGLPTERCPECGTPFDRGRLLVQQYVIEQGKRLWNRTGKYAKRLLIIGVLLSVVPLVLVRIASALIKPTAMTPQMTDWVMKLVPAVMAVMTLGTVLLFVAVFLYMHLATVGRKKYTQVLGSINRENPSYKAAQKRKWILWLAWLSAMVVLLVIAAAKSGRIWYRYYALEPAHLLIPIIMALGIGIVFYIGIFILKQRQDNRNTSGKT